MGGALYTCKVALTLHVSSEATRESLLEAAWLLLRRDPDSASMARIAAEAGVSRQAAYLHFQSRAGLLLAVVRWVDEREGIAARLGEALSEKAPRAALGAVVHTWLDYLPRVHPVALFLSRSTADAEAHAAWDDRMSELEKVYRRPLRELHKNGELRDGLSADQAVALLRGIASVEAWHFLVHERDWPHERAVHAIIRAASGALFG